MFSFLCVLLNKGFQDRRIRPLCHFSRPANGFPIAGANIGSIFNFRNKNITFFLFFFAFKNKCFKISFL